ncbi:MAG: cupin domain-containing protein [Bacteroidia bacterium]
MPSKKKYTVQKYFLKDDGRFPNNAGLPVLLYKNALALPKFFPGNFIMKLFAKNGWKNAWKDGVYDFHHYHSTTHEVLGVYRGKTTVLLGGTRGVELTLEKGDVLVIPAGVAHKNITPKSTFKCVGAYPDGKEYDMNYGKIGERPGTDKNIRNVAIPETDPLGEGAIQKYWKKVLDGNAAKKRSNSK